jgi:hypothetical protein
MAVTITNNKRSKSIIRVTGTGNTLINLSSLSADSDETIQSASLTTILSTSNGIWTIYRGDDSSGTLILELPEGVDWPLTLHDISISDGKTSNIFVTNTGANGTLILTVSKQAVYDPPATGM